MNPMRKRDRAQVEETVEHRRREDAAPRLLDEVRALQSLRLKLEEVRSEGRQLAMPYVRPIVVATAPAYFEIRCMEPRCDGRHDLTQPLMRALRESQAHFTGQSRCMGMVGDVSCDRLLSYECNATYRR